MLNADGTKPIGMFFAIRAERFERPYCGGPLHGNRGACPLPSRPGGIPVIGVAMICLSEGASPPVGARCQPTVLTTQIQTTTTEQTNTGDRPHFSAGQETNVSADATPTTSNPGGTSQQGEIASSSVSIANATMPARMDASPAATTRNPPRHVHRCPRCQHDAGRRSGRLPALFAGIGWWAWRCARA